MRLKLFASVFVASTLSAFAAEPSKSSASTPAVDSQNFASQLETLIAAKEKIQTALLALKGEGAMSRQEFRAFVAKQGELLVSIDRILALFAEPGAKAALAKAGTPPRLELDPDGWRILRRVWAADHKINLTLESHWDEWHAATPSPPQEPAWRSDVQGLSNEVRVATKEYEVLNAKYSGAANSPKPSLQDQESTPRFISPDGKFGLLITKGPEGAMTDRVELVEMATKRSLVVLSDPERPERADKARLDWSTDSKRVAAFIGTRVDGFTRIFDREGDGFVEVKLPDLPKLPNPEEPSAAFRKTHDFKFLKWITTDSLKFVRWLKDGVELRAYNEVATTDGGGFKAEIEATIAINSKHHATLKKAVRTESLE